MRYSKDLLWLKPFVESVASVVPIEKLVSIRGYRVPIGKSEGTEGLCRRLDKNRYAVTLLTHRKGSVFGDHNPLRVESILTNLAHELAHVDHWDEDKHTARFARRAHKIMGLFIKQLSKSGIDDIQSSYAEVRG